MAFLDMMAPKSRELVTDYPQFQRLTDDLQRARIAYEAGDMKKYRALMGGVGSLVIRVLAES